MKSLISSFFAVAAFFFLLPSSAVRAEDEIPVMPLSDVKPGMTGEWRSVVSGTRIDRFPLQVVGIAQNFIGPQRPVIICRALDATNKLTGPVAGMSGSPVFINGRLIGAYAYGFLWPKDQALIGVTPIGQMLEVETNYPPGLVAPPPQGLAQTGASAPPQWLVAPASGAANAPSPAALQSAMQPLPTPLFVSGVSERVLRRFSSRLAALGLDVMQAPSGPAREVNNDLEPGSPLAGVLMSGDFDFAGTGTVTWRSGNRILAFGHPFLQSGPSEMPMASAQILTVVQSVQRSFKLSNTGPVIGTIYQDRLTAVAGEIGRIPDMTHFEAWVDAPGGRTRTFQGELFQNQMLSPVISSISLEEALEATMEAEQEQTIYMETTVEIPGYQPVKLLDAASGEAGGVDLAMRELRMYGALLNNPCRFPKVKSLTFHARLVEGRNESWLDSLNLDRNEARPGATLRAVIGLRHYHGEPTMIPVAIPVPADLRAPEVRVFVGDADAAQRMDEPPTVPPQTLGQVLDRLRHSRSHQDICVKLLETAPGVAVAGRNLPDLPPSVMAQFQSPNASLQTATLSRITLWETNLPVAGTFSGQMTLPVRIK
ncbi:MAG: hypothetical protein KGJ60_13805 [Verrucomicrobiota bacterium]|nr:hypothetical protein [Verrucomicrobiota bacterium]